MEAALDSKDWIFPLSNRALSTGLLDAYYAPSTGLGLGEGWCLPKKNIWFSIGEISEYKKGQLASSHLLSCGADHQLQGSSEAEV